ncbi:MAG: hypothetical protein IJY66_04270, partial [Clostridia bacterium]|nr:hypothetical protein [Clostridia bacterium]
MFRCAKQQVFLARKASIAQSANEKHCAHGAAAPTYPAVFARYKKHCAVVTDCRSCFRRLKKDGEKCGFSYGKKVNPVGIGVLDGPFQRQRNYLSIKWGRCPTWVFSLVHTEQNRLKFNLKKFSKSF